MSTRSTTLEIDGMHCAACVARVEKALAAASGVDSATVNLATASALIEHDDEQSTAESLARISTAAGYPARERSADARAAERATRQRATARTDALRRDVIIAATLAIPVFLLAMFPIIWPWPGNRLVQFLLCTTLLLGPASGFYRRGLPALIQRRPDMDTLVAVGTLAAWLLSSVAIFLPQWLPDDARGVYFESAAIVVLFVLLGRWLEARARSHAGDAIRHLLDLQPKQVRLWRDGRWQRLLIDQLVPGDRVLVHPGERISVDGRIEKGFSHIDESMLSGEPIPVARSLGDAVSAGTLNGEGALELSVERIGNDTTLARIIALVEHAQATRLPIQSLLNRITHVFVPIILLIAAITGLAWMVLQQRFDLAWLSAVAVLVVACPCALGLATPMSIMVGTGRAAREGVLFRNGEALQQAEAIDAILLDKTGTLTEGQPAFETLIRAGAAASSSDRELLALMASIEQESEHPLARAIVAEAEAQGSELPTIGPTRVRAGHGIEARLGEKTLRLGSRRWLEENGVDCSELDEAATALAARGSSLIWMASDQDLAGLVAVHDRIKADAAMTIAALKHRGLRIGLLSGDGQATVQQVAAELGIDHFVAEARPAAKAEAVRQWQSQGQIVAFVGDGINDAPALASADVGFALGSGTDIAIETGDVVLLSSDTTAIIRALGISRATMRNIRQNLGWAFAYNLLLVPVAAGVFYPAFGLSLSPMLAGAAMGMSSLFVVMNALRLNSVQTAQRAR